MMMMMMMMNNEMYLHSAELKRSGSDRECKYFPIGMNAREPL